MRTNTTNPPRASFYAFYMHEHPHPNCVEYFNGKPVMRVSVFPIVNFITRIVPEDEIM